MGLESGWSWGLEEDFGAEILDSRMLEVEIMRGVYYWC